MTSFDLDRFLSLPRVAGLALSPDGTRLVTSVATVSPDGKPVGLPTPGLPVSVPGRAEELVAATPTASGAS